MTDEIARRDTQGAGQAGWDTDEGKPSFAVALGLSALLWGGIFALTAWIF